MPVRRCRPPHANFLIRYERSLWREYLMPSNLTHIPSGVLGSSQLFLNRFLKCLRKRRLNQTFERSERVCMIKCCSLGGRKLKTENMATTGKLRKSWGKLSSFDCLEVCRRAPLTPLSAENFHSHKKKQIVFDAYKCSHDFELRASGKSSVAKQESEED